MVRWPGWMSVPSLWRGLLRTFLPSAAPLSMFVGGLLGWTLDLDLEGGPFLAGAFFRPTPAPALILDIPPLATMPLPFDGLVVAPAPVAGEGRPPLWSFFIFIFSAGRAITLYHTISTGI